MRLGGVELRGWSWPLAAMAVSTDTNAVPSAKTSSKSYLVRGEVPRLLGLPQQAVQLLLQAVHGAAQPGDVRLREAPHNCFRRFALPCK